jgi:hypothetical protein
VEAAEHLLMTVPTVKQLWGPGLATQHECGTRETMSVSEGRT